MNKFFDKALNLLKAGRKIIIVFDTDGDGIGAAVILAKSIKMAFKRTAKVIPRDHGQSLISKNLVKNIIGKFDLVVFLDIAADENPEYINKLSKVSRVLIIDHHRIHKNLNSRKIIHINPSLWKTGMPSNKYCTSKIVYDICSGLTNIEDLDWLAAIGIVNDKAENVWRGFLKNVSKKYKISLKQISTVNDIVTSSYQLSKNRDIGISFKACMEANSPVDILNGRTGNSKKLKGFYEVVEEEIKSIMNDWKKNAEIYENKKLIILELVTSLYINSTISTLISMQRPHYTVIVTRANGKNISASLRRQDRKVNCDELAKKMIKGVKSSSGGGHVPAAGAKFMKKDWIFVKERLKKLL